jgi:hypothetical protein
MKKHLQLVVDNSWVMLPLTATANKEILHKEYNYGLHGLVFVDEHGVGNATIVDVEDNCLALNESGVVDLVELGTICDRLFIDLTSREGMA